MRAEQDADRWIVARGHHISLIPAHVGFELTHVLMAELGHLQLDQHMALEDAMVKDQVNEPVGFADQDALLSRLEAEAVS